MKTKTKVFTKNGTLFSPKSSKDQKKRSSPKVEQFFPPNSSRHLRSDAHQSQIIGGDADVDHTQTIGGDTAKLLGGYIPHPPGFRHPCRKFSARCLAFSNEASTVQKIVLYSSRGQGNFRGLEASRPRPRT